MTIKVRFKTKTLEALQFDGTMECGQHIVAWMKGGCVAWRGDKKIFLQLPYAAKAEVPAGCWVVQQQDGFTAYSTEQFCQLFEELIDAL